MQDMTAIEVKAFVPSKDFALSKRFYQDLGFNLGWSSDELAYLHHGNSSFLLQNFYVKEHADNFMMHLLVENVVRYAKIHGIGHRPWLTALLGRRPTKVAAIALANKIARMAWAMMAKGERYRNPVALAR
jgi:hypothetical protein